MRILVVDDEVVSRKKMMKSISHIGDCEGVQNGKSAISAVRAALEDWQQYALITLDVSMPDISGVEVLSTIRELEAERGLDDEERATILMVTSHSDIETVKACVGKCDGYVIKPFNRDVIMEKLKKTGRVRLS